MNKETKVRSTESPFRPWFYLFGLAFLAIIIYYQTVTVASAHAAIGMVFVRQLSIIYHEDVKGKKLRSEMDDLSARMKAIEPYPEE